jgi:hypothetical protein
VIELTDEMRDAVKRRMGITVGGLDPWMEAAIKDVLAIVERDQVAIADDVRTVLAQVFHPHIHQVAGIWDRERVPCGDCAARARLAALFNDQAGRPR